MAYQKWTVYVQIVPVVFMDTKIVSIALEILLLKN